MNNAGVRVFVVDDEPEVAVTLSAILRINGFTSECFTNPVDALASALVNPPDLLLSDVVMPELSGIDLGLQIKALCPGCKVLLFSGHADTVDFQMDANRLGDNFHILPKPLNPSDLLVAIRAQGLQN